MEFERSSIPSETPFGVYFIDKDYINALRKADSRIINPDYNNTYIGPVFTKNHERGLVDYFVPIDKNCYNTDSDLEKIFRQEHLSVVFDFRLMIPCVDKRFLTHDDNNAVLETNAIKYRQFMEEEADHVLNKKGKVKPRTTAAKLKQKHYKSDEPSEIPYGIYDVDKEYIIKLKKKFDCILDPEITVRYCGPVYHSKIESHSVDFFVPVDPTWHEDEFYIINMINCVFARYFDFKKMIPVYDAKYIKSNDKDSALYAFIKNSKNEFEKIAEDVIRIFNLEKSSD